MSGWERYAACRTYPNPDAFSIEGEVGGAREVAKRIAAAKTICQSCPVRMECRDLGDMLDAKDVLLAGAQIYGGETPVERRRRRIPRRSAVDAAQAALWPDSKVCGRCGVSKPLSDLHWWRVGGALPRADSFRGTCIECSVAVSA